MRKIFNVTAVTTLSFALSSSAFAQDFSYKGLISSDLRMTLPGKDMPKEVEPWRFDRSDNSIKLTTAFNWDSVDAIADLSLVYSGRSEVNQMRTLQYRKSVDPYYIESDAIYIRISDFLLPGLDLRLGRQIIEWGAADKFNPTSVINPLDLEDPQDFGKRIANEMLSLTFAPDWELGDGETPTFSEFQAQLVWVPRLRSALLPYSSEYAFGEPEQFRRFVHSKTLHKLVDLQELFVKYGGKILYDVKVEEPTAKLSNSQLGLKVSFSLLGVDLSFLAYRGYDHNVQPRDVKVTAISTNPDVSNAIDKNIHYVAGTEEQRKRLMDLMENFGYDGISTLTGHSNVTLIYPKVWVVGTDFATSLDALGGLGLWGELTLTIHDEVPIYIDINGTKIDESQVKGGYFFKGVLGMDNSFSRQFYLNVQYIYGFANEFGAENLNHYLMLNADIKAINEQMLIRLSFVGQLTDPSLIFMPSLSFKFWPGTEIIAGALLHFGKANSTFGNRVVGPNYAFLQAKYAF